MTDANRSDRHEPTDEFIDYLARDIQRAIRHQDRFAFAAATTTASPSRGPIRRALGMAAGVVMSLGAGVVLGASANAAAASEPTDAKSMLSIEPLEAAFKTIGCAVAPAAVASPAARTAAARRAVVDLPLASARSTQSVGAGFALQPMDDGRLLVNDGAHRQLRLFDPDLATSAVVLDSAKGDARSYASAGLGTIRSGRVAKVMLSFRGDSILFGPDGPPEQNMIVLDARGRGARTIAFASLGSAIPIPDSATVFDAKGRMIHVGTGGTPSILEVPIPATASGAKSPFGGRGGVGPTMRVYLARNDTLPIIRVDLDTRGVDTVGRVISPANAKPGENGVGNGGGKLVAVQNADGKVSVKQVVDPLPVVDEWAVLSDGTIAIVRGRDYHVDWIRLDGSRSSTARLPFAWRRLGAVDKQRLVDSTRASIDSLDAVAARSTRRVSGAPVERQFPYEIVAASKLPDAHPAFRAGAARADADGHLWIRTTHVDMGAVVYDVVSPLDGLVRRVRIPADRVIAGFGKGGVVYLGVPDGWGGFAIERTTLPRLAP